MQEMLKEQTFEAVIESHLLANGYSTAERDGFDRERAISPEIVLAFIRETQPDECEMNLRNMRRFYLEFPI